MNLNNLIPSLRQEVATLTTLRKNLPVEIFHVKMKDDLSMYFKNKDILDIIIERKTHLWEYSVILEMNSFEWFNDSLTFFIEEFNDAKAKNVKAVKKSLIKFYPLIQKALEGYSEAFHLSTLHLDKSANLFVRTVYRELGDILETSLLPILRQVHSLFSITKKYAFSFNSINAHFGEIVSDLCKIKKIEFLYKDFLYNVPLNQWRNIAHHSSYEFFEDRQIVICRYGTNNIKEVVIHKNEIEKFIKLIDKIFCLHKIAITFFTSDNGRLIVKSLPKLNISKDTIYASILAVFEVEGFKVLSLETKGENIDISVEFPTYPLKENLDSIIMQAGGFTMFRPNSSLSFKIFSDKGELLKKGFVKNRDEK